MLIGLLGWMFRRKKAAPLPIFLDSPMAIHATKIYQKHREIFDEQMKRFILERPLREDLVTLRTTVTAQDSMKINDLKGPCMILAGAGMCNGGRILHHLKRDLCRKETHILFVSYQGHGSLRRRIIEGQPNVQIHGQSAGQKDKLAWLSPVAPSKPRVVVIHGENGPRASLASCIQKRFWLKTSLPRMGETVEL